MNYSHHSIIRIAIYQFVTGCKYQNIDKFQKIIPIRPHLMAILQIYFQHPIIFSIDI